jgi:alpha,alpha-trehalase
MKSLSSILKIDIVPKRILLIFYFFFLIKVSFSQIPPDKIYGELFADVQMNKTLVDNKTFVDCVPKRDPKIIVAKYLKLKNNKAIKFSLKKFVGENFTEPSNPGNNFHAIKDEDIIAHINRLWDVLKRNPDKSLDGSSLLRLPYSYIVPGGRFQEIYYWDSYFTMLGLQESGRYDII